MHTYVSKPKGQSDAAPSAEVQASDGARIQRREARSMGFEEASAALAPKDAGAKLPHLEAIQRSFGAHDVSGVRAHGDERARIGARAIGAKAYATGGDVAFDGAPDLHTAAHEAAHVVQQRSGVPLAEGVGPAGDAHEQQADRAADAVVAGRSAEPFLPESAVGAESSDRPVVQRKFTGELAKLSVEELVQLFKLKNTKVFPYQIKQLLNNQDIELDTVQKLSDKLGLKITFEKKDLEKKDLEKKDLENNETETKKELLFSEKREDEKLLEEPKLFCDKKNKRQAEQYSHENVCGSPFGEDGEPRPEHVIQGGLGSCWLMAALDSLARDDKGKKLLQKMIEDTGGGYKVTFFKKKDDDWVAAETVIVSKRLMLLGKKEFAYALSGRPIDDKNLALWPAIIEKAAAVSKSAEMMFENRDREAGYSTINGGESDSGFQLLTGGGSKGTFTDVADDAKKMMLEMIKKGPTVATEMDGSGHAWSVISADNEFIVLRDPNTNICKNAGIGNGFVKQEGRLLRRITWKVFAEKFRKAGNTTL